MRQHVRYGTVLEYCWGWKVLTTANNCLLSNTADFSVFPPGAGVFFAKKDPPGVNSKVGGGS